MFLDEQTASAAVFKIADGDVAGLKNAIIAANTNGEDDVIELAPNGTYTLTTADNYFNGSNGLPRIETDGGRTLRIEGAGAAIQRSSADGTPQFRILYASTGANVTALALTIANGNLRNAGGSTKVGGGIYNDHGTLTVENGTLTGNSADIGGGIFSNGEHGIAILTLSNCALVNNSADVAGGIANDGISGVGVLNVNASTFIENYASWIGTGGGALFNEGYLGEASVMIENCTFVQNGAEHGGAIYNDGFQGHVSGIVTNSTFSTNAANASGGGIYNSEGSGGSVTLDIANCTFSQNSAVSGGAISDAGDPGGTGVLLRIGDNIFKSATSTENISSNVETIISLGHNLSNDNGSGFLTGPGDQINTDPILDPAGLQNNGGPTKTIALLPDSPAVNAGNPTGPGRDQRYYLRNGVPDIGAFEYGGTLAPLTAASRKAHGVVGTFDLVAKIQESNVVVAAQAVIID